jgi:hypothetical protein
MQGTKVIRVYPDGLKKLDKINSERPQDMSRADTFDYILRVFEESPLRIEICKELTKPRNAIAGNASSPIIDADNLRIITPTTMAEKLYADKLRKLAQDLALKAADAAPTKNNTYQESKE